MRKWLMVGAAALLAGLSLQASAHDECEGCSKAAATSFWPSDWNLSWHAGVSYLLSEFKDWNLTEINSEGFTSRDEDDGDTGYRLTAGMEFLEHFGVEATYTDFGEASFAGQSDGSGPMWAPGPQRDSLELDGFAMHLIARVPVGKDFSVAGKAGWWLWQARQHSTGTFYVSPGTPAPFDLTTSEDGIRFSWGAGLDYDGFKPVRVSVEYGAAGFESPNTADAIGASEIHSLSVSLKYMF